MKNKKPIMLVIGKTGLVGSGFESKAFKLVCPSSSELDITRKTQVSDYIAKLKPDVVLQLAAYTNVSAAEKEHKKTSKGKVWKVNVMGAVNVAEASAKVNAFMIYISTGFVQAKNRSWYADTKYQAEQMLFDMQSMSDLRLAIIRIDYPFGNLGVQNDYVEKMIGYLNKGYNLVDDQRVAPTYLPDLYKAINKIAEDKLEGIFHVACSETTPHKVGTLIAGLIPGLSVPSSVSLEEFQKKSTVPLPKNAALDTAETQEKLGLKFLGWEEAVTSFAKDWKKPRCLQIIRTEDLELTEEPYIFETAIKGLLLIKRPRYKDPERGDFQENFRVPDLEKAIGHSLSLQQSQYSESKPGVVRGIHAEDQDKIITPQTGYMISAYVDLRDDSYTRGHYVKVYFDNRKEDSQKVSVLVTDGIGNSLSVLGDEIVSYVYIVSKVYSPETATMGVSSLDPDLNIDWEVEDPIISQRDKEMGSLREYHPDWFEN